jgi:hypothetical protein
MMLPGRRHHERPRVRPSPIDEQARQAELSAARHGRAAG